MRSAKDFFRRWRKEAPGNNDLEARTLTNASSSSSPPLNAASPRPPKSPFFASSKDPHSDPAATVIKRPAADGKRASSAGQASARRGVEEIGAATISTAAMATATTTPRAAAAATAASASSAPGTPASRFRLKLASVKSTAAAEAEELRRAAAAAAEAVASAASAAASSSKTSSKRCRSLLALLRPVAALLLAAALGALAGSEHPEKVAAVREKLQLQKKEGKKEVGEKKKAAAAASVSMSKPRPKAVEERKKTENDPKLPPPARLSDLASADGETHLVYKRKRNIPLGDEAAQREGEGAWELSERRVVLPPRPPPLEKQTRRSRRKKHFFSSSSPSSENNDDADLDSSDRDSRIDALLSHAAVAGAWLLAQAAWRARRALGDAADAAADGGVAAVARQLRERVLHPFGSAARGAVKRLGGKRAERAVEASMAAAVVKTEAAEAAAAEVERGAAALAAAG